MKRTKDLDLNKSSIVGLSDEYQDGFEDPLHSHDRVQLLYASTGVMKVITGDTVIILPPQRALWIPAGVEHAVSCRGPVSLRTLYIDPKVATRESISHVIEVSRFLRALIFEITDTEQSQCLNTRDLKVIDLTLLELSSAQKVSHMTPMPRDPRLLRVCDQIVKVPSDSRTIDEFANVAGMSRRSFTRHFKKETGMSLNIWRQQIRLQEALSLLFAGTSVNVTASRVGYESASAFCSVFYRTFGISPGKFVR